MAASDSYLAPGVSSTAPAAMMPNSCTQGADPFAMDFGIPPNTAVRRGTQRCWCFAAIGRRLHLLRQQHGAHRPNSSADSGAAARRLNPSADDLPYRQPAVLKVIDRKCPVERVTRRGLVGLRRTVVQFIVPFMAIWSGDRAGSQLAAGADQLYRGNWHASEGAKTRHELGRAMSADDSQRSH